MKPSMVAQTEYQVSTPITGWMQLGVADLGGGINPPYQDPLVLNLNTLTETVSFDLAAGTVRQVGFVSVTPSKTTTVFHETRHIGGQTIPGDVTVYQELASGAFRSTPALYR